MGLWMSFLSLGGSKCVFNVCFLPLFYSSVLLIGFVYGLRSILSDGSVVVAHNTIQDSRHDTPRFVLLVFQSLFDSLVGGVGALF